ncbi:hypothetical protein [Paenibacillus polymyxa]|uniref:hypothetical protein n=1 Tax=Paenibacillus polymyxa TaxID=1406 RepID=UPI0021E485A6|nr:hypothetical protein [Paenibacillus polymyxa]
MNKAIGIPPYLLKQFDNINLGVKSIDEITLRDTKSVAIFSDYGADNADFDVFAHFIVDWNVCGELVKALKEVKKKHNIAERTIDYKGRKDKLKKAALKEWMQTIESFPGHIHVLAYDKRFDNEDKVLNIRRENKQDLLKLGFNDDKILVYERMAKNLSFFRIISKLLKQKHKVAWVSDHDTIFDTELRRTVLLNSLSQLVGDSMTEEKIEALSFLTPFEKTADNQELNEVFNELLSVADIAASSFAASLHYDQTQLLGCPDEETVQIIDGLLGMGHLHKRKNLSSINVTILRLDYYKSTGEPFLRQASLDIVE